MERTCELQTLRSFLRKARRKLAISILFPKLLLKFNFSSVAVFEGWDTMSLRKVTSTLQ